MYISSLSSEIWIKKTEARIQADTFKMWIQKLWWYVTN